SSWASTQPHYPRVCTDDQSIERTSFSRAYAAPEDCTGGGAMQVMKRWTRQQSLQRHNHTQPRVPLTPEEIARVKELVQHNKVPFSELLERCSRAVHQFDAVHKRTRHERTESSSEVSRSIDGDAEAVVSV